MLDEKELGGDVASVWLFNDNRSLTSERRDDSIVLWEDELRRSAKYVYLRVCFAGTLGWK